MTKCNAIGALMVGGRVVGQIRCGLDAGHDAPIYIWHPSVPVKLRHIGEGYPAPLSHFVTPHRAVLEWTPESDPDLDLFDPAERFDADVPIIENDPADDDGR